MSLMSFYFFPKVYLLVVEGADLNSHFQIVKKSDVGKVGGGNYTTNSGKIHASEKYFSTADSSLRAVSVKLATPVKVMAHMKKTPTNMVSKTESVYMCKSM